MIDQPPRLILASGSPRRKILLENAGYQFQVAVAPDDVENSVPRPSDIENYPKELAIAKASWVAMGIPDGVVLAADTIALCKGEVLGKPNDEADARRMLQLLSNCEHQVITACCLVHRPTNKQIVETTMTTLRFDPLSNAQIDVYIKSGQWQGKAGAFGFQDGPDWVHVVSGSESNVVGLPIEKLPQMFGTLKSKLPGGGW